MEPWLTFDPQEMRRDFNSRAFSFTHTLHESPLFSLRRLAELGDFLYAKGGQRDVYNAAAGRNFADAFTANGARALSPGEAIANIETSQSWMSLKRIEQHPDYKALVDAIVDQLGQAVPEFARPRIRQAEGFIFVTSPGGITPYHLDPQWAFQAQIRGKKIYRIYDVRDPAVISDQEIEDLYAGNVMAAKYDPKKDAHMIPFELRPGLAANQPMHAPHSAQVPDEVSISLSVAIVSDAWADQQRIRHVNRHLRKFGLNPAPIGAHGLADTLKVLTYRAANAPAYVARNLAARAGR